MLSNNLSQDINTFHRVSISKDSGNVVVICVGIGCIDSSDTGWYSSVNDLPEWIQDRLAILMITPHVDGIGWKYADDINETTFWVVKEMG